MSRPYEKPRERKGFVLTAVWWDRNGRVVRTTYEPDRKAKAAPASEPGECSDCGLPGPAYQPCRYCGPDAHEKAARGLVAAERGKPRQAGLFD